MPEAEDAAPAMEPVPLRERIREIDVLRGFALFGILAANMRGFNSPAQVYFAPEFMWPGTADQMVQALIDLLISGKFITLFSFLFGLGFAVQMGRAESRGARFVPFYCRRMAALLLIGLAHALLLWWGDILVPYALVGFSLLFFRWRLQMTVMTWAMAALWLPVFLIAVFLALGSLGVQIPGPPKPTKELIDQVVQAYSQGSLAQVMAQRLKELGWIYGGVAFFFPKILGMFLLGLYVWRRGIFENLTGNLGLIRKALWWGLGLGLSGSLAAVLVMKIWKPDPVQPSVPGLVLAVVSTIGIPALSCFYASAVILLFQKEAWRKRLAPLAAVGRTALSNYLLQTVVCTTIFYSYGFGLYGKVSPAAGLVPTFVLYLAQIPVSVWWLRRFRFGPMEWIWRSVTYGKLTTLPKYQPSGIR